MTTISTTKERDMRYSNSLTTSVQQHIGTVLARKIITANTRQQLGSTAREIRQYLTDPSSVSTPDFVIRRYIQTKHPQLLEEYKNLPDLTGTGRNVPWDSAVIRSLSLKLEKLSILQGAKFEAKEWRHYLTGKGCKKRTKAFMAAFTLQMGVEDTMDLLLSLGMESYCVRYPLDLICMFCQEHPGTYTWAEAQAMLDEFLEKKTESPGDVPAPVAGMTEQISLKLKRIFKSNLQSSNARSALLKYMTEHSAEFVSFKKSGKELFLPGYSLSRMELYMKMAEYLAVLYPHYTHRIPHKAGPQDARHWDEAPWNIQKKPVRDASGTISLTCLKKAMFEEALWSDIIWNEDKNASPFEQNMYLFCNNYERHVMAIDRLRKGGSSVAFFDRRDALLFTYFLISGYIQLLDSPDPDHGARIKKIQDMAFSDNDFDMAVDEVLAKAEQIFSDDNDATPLARFNSLCECFNMILAQLDYQNLYLPAQFDRFVLLSLLAEDPAELSTVVMSQSDWEFYYGDTDEPA